MGYQALLFCTDDKLSRVASQVFSELEFAVDPVTEPFGAVKKLMAQHFDAIVVDCENEQNAALLFKSARNSNLNQGSLAIALVEGQAGVAKAYRIGANLVLTKPINVEQAKGTLRVARGLLRKTTDPTATSSIAVAAAAGAGTSTSSASAAPPVNRIVEAEATEFPEFEDPSLATTAAAKIAKEPGNEPVTAATPVAIVKGAPAPTLVAAKAPPENTTTIAAAKPTLVPALSTGSRSAQAAAIAPAPAAEVVIIEDDTEIEAIGESLKDKDEDSGGSKAGSTSQARTQTPAFSSHYEAAGKSGGSRKILIVAAAALLLSAGYIGWSKFGATKLGTTTSGATISGPTSSAGAISGATHQTASEDVTTTPQPATGSSPAARSTAILARSNASVSTAVRETASTVPTNALVAKNSFTRIQQSPEDISSPTRAAIHPQIVPAEIDNTNAAAPLVVKSSPKSRTEELSAALPSPLAVASAGDSVLPKVLSGTPPDIARPTLVQTKLSQGVSQGMVIKRVQPKYPTMALSRHLEGQVQLEVTVNKEGNVVNPKVLKGDRILAAAALDAVRQWRYKPYYLNGQPVEIQTQITINFKSE